MRIAFLYHRISKITLCVIILLGGLCLNITIQAKTNASENKNKSKTHVLISQQVHDGRVEWLSGGASSFLAIYKESGQAKKAKGGILLLPDPQGSANEPELIGPLRRLLPTLGWATLAISLPDDLKNTPQYITAGRDYLQRQHIQTVIILSYGRSAQWVIDYLSQQQQADHISLILISAHSQKPDESLQQLEKLVQNKIKIIDVMAQHDFLPILRQGQQRLAKHQPYYRQIEILGADPYYSQLQTQVAKHLHSWLTREKI